MIRASLKSAVASTDGGLGNSTHRKRFVPVNQKFVTSDIFQLQLKRTRNETRNPHQAGQEPSWSAARKKETSSL